MKLTPSILLTCLLAAGCASHPNLPGVDKGIGANERLWQRVDGIESAARQALANAPDADPLLRYIRDQAASAKVDTLAVGQVLRDASDVAKAEKARADKAEATFGYRAERKVRAAFWWTVALGVPALIAVLWFSVSRNHLGTLWGIVKGIAAWLFRKRPAAA